nr:chorismate mutase [Murinocardiopsis flavida]
MTPDDGAVELAELRRRIDEVDSRLAELLEQRAILAAGVQRVKPVGGFAGRDAERERALVAAMAGRAPRLGEERLARIMAGVIEAGLEAAEQERGVERP